MNKIKRFLIGATAGAVLLTNAVLPVGAASTLFGEASIVAGGNPGMALQLVSDAAPGYAGASFDDANEDTFGSLTTLSTDYNVTDDDCGAGSPRFQISLDTNNDNVHDGNVFVYFGPSPSFTDCASGWQSTGNLIGNADAGRFDATQVGGGLGTYASVLPTVGTYEILEISVASDSGWNANAANGADGEQTVLIDNVMINSAVYDFEPETVTVTIDKYIDSSMATATSANSSAFPMSATWNAINIGAGSGNYDLDADGFNNIPTPYQAITSEMTAGADYTTNEVTGGSVVGANCSTGQPYALVGYSTGNTLSEAQGGTPSSTIPSFTDLQDDKFVIVWNMTCPVVTPTPPLNAFDVPAQCDQTIAYNLIQGTNGSEVLNGTDDPDMIYARGGSDVVYGKGGADCIVGGAGSDYIVAGNGNDVVLGGTESDSITGGLGNDDLYGQDGSDSLNGNAGNDELRGGAGSDSLKGEGGMDTLIGDGGSDAANGGTGSSDTCTAESKAQCEL